MAASNLLCTAGKVLGGIFLSLAGSWLLVVCLGGLLTLGVLSVFHLGVLLSLGCIGLCLLLIGVCAVCHFISSKEPDHGFEDHAFSAEETRLPSASSRKKSDYRQPFHLPSRSEKYPALDQKSTDTHPRSYNPFN